MQGLKIILGLGILLFIGIRVFHIFSEDWTTQIELNDLSFFIGLAVAFLMIINWLLEALKWKTLVELLEPISLFSALKGVLAGLSTGILTPNRLGNFLGRTLLLSPDNRLKGTLLTLLANMAQFITTIFFGLLSLIAISVSFFEYSNLILGGSGILLLALAFRVYMKPSRINRKPFNYLFSERIVEGIDYVSRASNQIKLNVLVLSFIRYAVFVTQYVLLLLAFNQDRGVFLLLTHVSVVYLLMTLLPSLFFGKLFVREAAALVVLSLLGIPDSVIILTGFTLWFINIALPSLVGVSLLMGKK